MGNGAEYRTVRVLPPGITAFARSCKAAVFGRFVTKFATASASAKSSMVMEGSPKN
jgi:hypothetical protein